MCLGIIDEVPDYEIVIGITHAVDYRELIFCTLQIIIFASRRRRNFKSLLKALIRQVRQVFFVTAIARRHFINRKMYSLKIVFRITHLSDLDRVIDGFGKLRKETSHLSLGLNIELITGHAHPVLVIYPGSR